MAELVDKGELRLGNMFEQGIVYKISGRTGARVHLYGKGKWYDGFRKSVAVEDLSPIILTPEILVEWCGFNYRNDSVSSWYYYDEYLTFTLKEDDGVFHIDLGCYDVEVIYLHELQNLYYALNKGELEIKG